MYKTVVLEDYIMCQASDEQSKKPKARDKWDRAEIMSQASDGDSKKPKARDKWDKAEIILKAISAISVPIFGALIAYVLNSAAERNRHSEIYANVIAEREKADSDIRAQAFNSLMANYMAKPEGISKPPIEDYRTKAMVSDLLVDNFQDYFDPEPLFYDLHQRISERSSDGA